jgi:hypothetical protein
VTVSKTIEEEVTNRKITNRKSQILNGDLGLGYSAAMVLLFAATLFTSAFLLFVVQPLIARLLLPVFGGAPAVWNTCMLFFQGMLLAGYAYAHGSANWLGARRQAVLHVVLLIVPMVVGISLDLPVDWEPAPLANPIWPLLGRLLVTIGLPFFLISANAPTLQRWFAETGHAGASDPYFLYSGSNLGSLIALIAYPLLLEPAVASTDQCRFWIVGYGVLVAMIVGCAIALWRSQGRHPVSMEKEIVNNEPKLSRKRRLRWLALAFVPSSLMLGVTMYLSTDIAPVPLLWVVPLAIYLVTFVLAFGHMPRGALRIIRLAMAVFVLLAVGLMLSRLSVSLGVLLATHLTAFFLVALVCHCELGRDRPPVRHLTEFYLWISAGGALGGVWSALVAPCLFSSIVEYPLAIMGGCLLMPAFINQGGPLARWLDFTLPVALGLLAAVALRDSGTISAPMAAAIVCGLAIFLVNRPVRFGLGVGALLAAHAWQMHQQVDTVLEERNFFGVLRVLRSADGRLHRLMHGNTMHGAQIQSSDSSVRDLPLMYYDPTGPIGQVFMCKLEKGFSGPVGIIGLGAGSLASYGRERQEFTFFEIDPAVERIATDSHFFTFLRDSRARWQVLLGDARLTLRHQPDGHYGLLVVDAFNSDAIPVHLLTQEAIQLYERKLDKNGVLALHISNKYLDLEPIVANLARALALTGLSQREGPTDLSAIDRKRGKLPSQWVLMARDWQALKPFDRDRRWHPLVATAPGQAWSDDFHNVFEALRWR